MSQRESVRKVRIGNVVSSKMDKTIVVREERNVRHPVFGRTVKKYAKYKAHDNENSAKEGDLVKIMETRPLSKDKRWRLVEILQRAK